MRTIIDIVFAVCLLTLLACAFFIFDIAINDKTPNNGVIVDLSFNQGSTSTHTGIVLNSKGGASPFIGTSTTSDKWLAIVKLKSGEIVKVECEKEKYYNLKIGDSLNFFDRFGIMTGIYWGSETAE